MSEERAAASETSDPTAISLALSGASRDKADAYLDDQRGHLHEQLKQIHLDIWEKWLGVLLRVATLIVGLGAAAGIGLMVWDAAHSNGLTVEPFSVPPDLAARGLTGQAVASRVLDRLSDLQNRTQSARPPQSYSNNWGTNLKVEIPETGISIGEFQHFLRDWLGHDTHITGEVWRTEDGVAVVARAGGDSGEIVRGSETDLEDLIQKSAENVYRVTQPYRYANFLDRFYQDAGPLPADAKARLDQAEAIYRRLTFDPRPAERAWAWNGLGTQGWSARGNVGASLDYYRESLQEQPDFGTALSALAQWAFAYGHWEDALDAGRRFLKVAPGSTLARGLVARFAGDHAAEADIASEGMRTARTVSGLENSRRDKIFALAELHEARRARALHDTPLPLPSPYFHNTYARTWILSLVAMEDWPGLITAEPQAENTIRTSGVGWDTGTEFVRILRPALALAKAHLGDVAGAQALIAAAPLDCDQCNLVRGEIAAIAGKPQEADAWLTRLVHDSPSSPLVHAEWGRLLLQRGQPDAAIEKFTIANRLGPKFADALEGWGEALMAKNQSHLALEKFAEAEKYAPNWGRLHLKWGEALYYAGKKDDAKAQFARAAQLDLTPSEQSELAGAPHG